MQAWVGQGQRLRSRQLERVLKQAWAEQEGVVQPVVTCQGEEGEGRGHQGWREAGAALL